MKTETQVRDIFLAERVQFISIRENKEYAKSLDCALAVMLECEKLGIDYPESYEVIKSVVQEKGDFWNACVKDAMRKMNNPETPTIGEIIAIKALALHVGTNWLVEGFQEGF